MQFHERLKKYRKEMGLTQEEFAQNIHVSRSAVAKWENGLGLPSDDSLDAIAVFFHVDREELLADRETETIIVEKNGKLSRQKMFLLALIVLAGVLLIASAILLGVFLTRGYDDTINGNHAAEDEEPTVEGIDKTDRYTWFDLNKSDLPNLKDCKEVKKGMSLNQVINLLGKPQREVGYGAVLLQFDLDDGSILTITFVDDSEKMTAKPNLTAYDYLIVYVLDFNRGIPDVYFPYCGGLDDLYTWINGLQESNIVQVRFEFAYIGVAPGRLKDISYSTDRSDIKNTYQLLFRKLTAVSDKQGQIVGGSYVKYDFLTADNKTYSIKVSNNIVMINHQYYRLNENFYYAFEHPDRDCHSFITYDTPYFDEYEIYSYENEGVKIGDYNGLGEFEFCRYDGVIENAPRFYLKNPVLNLLILSDDLFMIEHDNDTIVYQIIGEKNFSALFSEDIAQSLSI